MEFYANWLDLWQSLMWCQFPMSSFSKWMWIRQEEILNSNRNRFWFVILNLPMSIRISAVHDEYEIKIEKSISTISNRFAELDNQRQSFHNTHNDYKMRDKFLHFCLVFRSKFFAFSFSCIFCRSWAYARAVIACK